MYSPRRRTGRSRPVSTVRCVRGCVRLQFGPKCDVSILFAALIPRGNWTDYEPFSPRPRRRAPPPHMRGLTCKTLLCNNRNTSSRRFSGTERDLRHDRVDGRRDILFKLLVDLPVFFAIGLHLD